MKWLKSGVLFLVLCLAVCGCINYEEELTLSKDGSASMHVHYYMDTSMIESATQGGSSPSFDKAELEKQYNVKGVKLDKADVYDKDGKRHVEMDFSIADLNKIPVVGPFSNREFSVTKEKGTLVYRTVLKMNAQNNQTATGEAGASAAGTAPAEGNTGAVQGGGAAPDASAQATDQSLDDATTELMNSLYKDSKFKYTLIAPGKILTASPNGTIEKNKITWEFSLLQVMQQEIVMTAKISASMLPAWIMYAAGAVILAGLVLLLLLKARKKSGKQPAAAGVLAVGAAGPGETPSPV